MQTTALRPKRRYTLYTAGIAAAMMLAVYIMMGIWPFGDGSIVTGDLGGLYLNYFGHLKRALSGSAGFAYGFDKGMGGSLLGLYAYYYSSPFNFIYCHFPLRWFPVAASVVLFAKTVLACVFFRVYIAAKFPQLGWRSVPLALCYGFLAYGFAYAQNIMWHDVVLLLPLICLGIDRIVAGKSPTLYIAVLAVAIFANFYIAYMACIFVVLYFFYSMLTRPAGAGATPLAPARKNRWAEWKLPLMHFAGGSLLGGGLTAALLVPALVNINRNKGDLLSFSFSFETNFSLSRLPERFVWGSFAPTDVEGHLPFVYCGLLVLVLVGAYFFSRSVSLKEKLLGGGILLLFLLSFWVKGLDLVWHGLKEPVWFPARYSYLFCFFLVLLAAKALAAKAAGRRAVLLGGGLLFVILLAMTAFPIAISRSRIALSAAAVLFYSFCLVLAATATSLRRRRVVYGVLIAAVAVELAMNGYFISSGFDSYTLSSHQGRVDANVDTLEAIEAVDGADDYRIATTHYHSLNDAMLLGYSGLSHFGSTQDGYAQSVLYNLGLRSYEGGGPYLNGGTAFADSVAGLRYLSSDGSLPVATHWAETGLETPYTVYRNPYVFPMVFMVDGAKLADTEAGYQQDMFAYQNGLYTELGGAGTLFGDGGEVKLLDADKNSYPPVGEVPSGGVYRLTAQRDGQHYVWFESGIQLLAPTVDGVERNLYFSPYNKGAIDLGWLTAGQTVEITFGNAAAFEVTGLRFVWMDTDGLAALSETVNANGGSFTVRDGRVGGSITAENDHSWLFTSIPWDPDWRATVNGKPVETRMVAGGLIALPLEAGENIVEMTFVPGGSAAGWTITAVCAAAFAALLIWGGLRRRKTRRAAQPARDYPEEAQARDGHIENAATEKTEAGEG
ncbi:YfhO family protein [Ruminococcaceae bacterium OttesenSCG-928-D13]|nr:YfhO family protein [Ruminococcaceae bacterium OttesenSCG-928-D13]